MEQGNTDRLLEVLADLGYGSVEEFFDYFPYDKIFNELWQGELEANSLTEIAFAAHISAQYAMQFAPTFTKVEEFMRGDNEINAEILQSLLEMRGASCTICRDGAEVVEKFRTVAPGEYDAILMDVQMPGMDGYEATRTLRSGANPLGRTIPIIAMTANAFAEDVKKSLDAGMNAHLSKPVDLNALEQTLQRFRYEPSAEQPQ